MTDLINDNRDSVQMSHRTRARRTITQEDVKRARRSVVLDHVVGDAVDRQVGADPESALAARGDLAQVARRQRRDV